MSNWQIEALSKLGKFVSSSAGEFTGANPFPHCVLDNFFDNEVLNELLTEFPETTDPIWEASTQEGIQVKLRSNWQSEADIRPVTKSVVHFFNSGAVMKQL